MRVENINNTYSYTKISRNQDNKEINNKTIILKNENNKTDKKKQ